MAGAGTKLIIASVVVAIFGPYLFVGVRTEQAVIYSLLVLILPFRFLEMRVPHSGMPIVAAWTLYVLTAAAGLAVPIINRTPWPAQSSVAGLDNLLLPLAVTGSVWAVVPSGKEAESLAFASRAIALLIAMNGLLAMVMTKIDLTAALRPFFGGPGDSTVFVADLAAQLGRYSGVFNQPAEAGLAYSIGGLAACFGWRHRPAVVYLLIVPIVLGGLLCVSKVFLLGGLPIILWQLVRVSRRHRMLLMGFSVGSALLVLETGFLVEWSGFGFLSRLFDPTGSGGLIDLYTAGRLGDRATLTKVIDAVWIERPLAGFGAAGLAVPYDNGWVEALVVAGLVGVVAYTATLMAMAWMARTDDDRERRSFLTSISIVAFGASVGLPALTANRAASLLWLLIAMGALAHRGGRRQHPLDLSDAQSAEGPVGQASGPYPAGLPSASRPPVLDLGSLESRLSPQDDGASRASEPWRADA